MTASSVAFLDLKRSIKPSELLVFIYKPNLTLQKIIKLKNLFVPKNNFVLVFYKEGNDCAIFWFKDYFLLETEATRWQA